MLSRITGIIVSKQISRGIYMALLLRCNPHVMQIIRSGERNRDLFHGPYGKVWNQRTVACIRNGRISLGANGKVQVIFPMNDTYRNFRDDAFWS